MTGKRSTRHCHSCGVPQYNTGFDDTSDPVYCFACNLQAELLANKMLDRAAMQIENSLQPANADKFRNKNPDTRRAITAKLIARGYFTWSIS